MGTAFVFSRIRTLANYDQEVRHSLYYILSGHYLGCPSFVWPWHSLLCLISPRVITHYDQKKSHLLPVSLLYVTISWLEHALLTPLPSTAILV